MEKDIKKFKESDTVTYSTKELIGGLKVQMDRIEGRLTSGQERFAKIETSIKWHKRLLLGLYTIVMGSMIKPVRSILTKIFGGF